MANSAQRVPSRSRVRIRPRTDTPNARSRQNSAAVPPPPPKKAKPPAPFPPSRPLSPLLRGFFWGTAVTLMAVVSGSVGAAIALVSPLAPNISTWVRQGEAGWSQVASAFSGREWGSLLPYRLDRPLNLLILGTDRVLEAREGSVEAFGGRSDTLLLLRFEPGDRSLRMLSIPRDSRVEIPGVGYGKINEANARGGAALAARVASKTLNDVPVDRYLRVTTDTFKQLVDLVGGVEVFVPYPMSYRDVTQNLEIDLQPGLQTLNGEQAEQFARFRKDGYGDIGRVQRQQVLLKALQKRLYSPALLPKIPQALEILQKNLDTNLTWEEMLSLIAFARELQREDIQMVMLPGRFSQPEEYETSFWLVSQQGRDRVMREYFDLTSGGQLPPQGSPHQVRIAIQNGTDDPSLGNRLREALAANDYDNVYFLPDSPQRLQETEIVVQKGDLAAARALQSVLGVGRVEASSTGDLDSDLTLRLGPDAGKLTIGESFVSSQ